jgi:sensor histidine kinase YesM
MGNFKISYRRAALVFLGWTLVSIIFAGISYAAAIGENNKEFGFISALRLNLVQFYVWAILSPLVFRFSRRFPIELRPLNVRNLLLYFPALISFAGIHQVIHLAVLWSITPRWRQKYPALTDCYRAYFAFGFYIDLIIALLIVIAVHALLYYQSFRASELAQSSLKTDLAQAQLRALKMQLHPHFLFNTLHSISSLVLEDPPKANSMIARLGDFLRLTVDNSDQQLVTLKEETEFLRCYLDIEQVRFGDRLTVTLNSLLRVAISDNGPGISSNPNLPWKQGVGLTNVRTRLQQIYGPDFRFELMNANEGGLTAVMEIPFEREPNPGLDQESK